MRHLLVIAAFTALAFAKPEFYKEKEDFQYSRSSTDEGSKSGFYGAQRGNMGGNYEKAHNMDGLAQHQMSGLVRTTDGELGDGFKTRTGSVYSAANSRGIYGSGHYDLSNLQGRHFEETESFGNSHSSMMSQSAGFGNSRLNSGAYGGSNRAHSSGYRGYQAGDQSQQYMQTDNLQSADQLHSAHGYDYGSEAAQLSTSGFQSHHDYDLSTSNLDSAGAYGSNTRSRILSTAPVRVIVRPGIRRTVPLTAQVYDADHSDTSLNLEHSNINKETELLNTDGQQVSYSTRPSNSPKHYESSYSYHKEWEKHNTQPINVPGAVPTENPFPVQSQTRGDLNEENNLENTQHHSNINAYNLQASNTAFAANSQSSNQARYQAGYNTKHSSSSSLAENANGYNTGRRSTSLTGSSLTASNANEYNTGRSSSLLASTNTNGYKTGSSSSLLTANTNGYNVASHGTNSEERNAGAADSRNLVQFLTSKPKSYQSSYSYHKSWERQGDPYIIKPAGSSSFDEQASQKLTAASASQGAYSSHHYGSQHKQTQHSFSHNGFDSDCDEEGHVRVTRSSDSHIKPEIQTYQDMYQGQDEYGQQTQNRLENLEELGQQTQNQWDNLQSFGQQEQSNWENSQNLGQQIQSQWDNLQDLGQQPQHQWDNLQNLGQETEGKFGKLEDLGQHQSQWDIGSQEIEQKFDTLHTMGQQTQNQWGNMPEIGQITQGKLDKLEDFGQQTQTQWDKIENFDQQSQNKLDKIEDLGQQPQATWESPQQQNRSWQKLESLNQHTQRDLEQQTQDHDEQTSEMVSYGKEFGQEQNAPSNGFDINDTPDSQSTDQKQYSGSNLSQKEDKDSVTGSWNNLMVNLGGFQQKNSDLDLNDQNLTDTNNGNFDRPLQTQNSEMHDFGSPKIFPSQQTQDTWNTNEEDTVQQKPFEQNGNINLNDANWHDLNHLQTQAEKSSHTTDNSYPVGSQWDKTDSEFAEPDKYFNSQDEQNSLLLGGLWDKIDGIAKQTLKDIDDDDETQQPNKADSLDWSQQESKPSAPNNTPKLLSPHVNRNLLKPNVRPNQDKHTMPIDVGRGDIGSEDTDLTSYKPETNKPYKTLNVIDSLSLTRQLNTQSTDSNNDKNNFNVLSDNELKVVQDLMKKIESEYSDEIEVTSTSTTISPILTIATKIDENILEVLNENEEKLVQAINNKLTLNKNKKRTTTALPPTRDIYEQKLRNKDEFEHNTNTNAMSHHHYEHHTNGHKELDRKNEDYEPEEQQNLEQHFEDFHQTQDLQNPSQLENFVQQHQSHWNSENNLAQVLDQQLLHLGEVSQKFDEKQIKEEIREIEATHQTKMHNLTPPEPEPEPEEQTHGFWKSVGSKLTNAKKKVISWFS